MLAAVVHEGTTVCVFANVVAGALDVVVAVGTVVSVSAELEEIVGVEEAVIQPGNVACVHAIVVVGVLLVVVHEGTTV